LVWKAVNVVVAGLVDVGVGVDDSRHDHGVAEVRRTRLAGGTDAGNFAVADPESRGPDSFRKKHSGAGQGRHAWNLSYILKAGNGTSDRSTLTKNSGMSLVEVMIAVSVMSVVGLGLLHINSELQKAARQGTAKTAAREIRQNLVQVLENNESWVQTVSHKLNQTFLCLSGTGDCHEAQGASKPGLPYAILDPVGQVFYDGQNPTLGYTLNGAKCDKFPSPACPFHVELTWRPLCLPPPVACRPSQVEVSGRVIFDVGPTAPVNMRMAYNPDNYAFKIIKSVLSGTASPNSPVPSGSPTSGPTGTPSPVLPGAAMDHDEALMQMQKEVLCKTVAPSLSGLGPEKLKETLRNMGYPDSMYDAMVSALQDCKSPVPAAP
jgi:prepilin-type N-terminal cleavage/methylation domain-containing protein